MFISHTTKQNYTMINSDSYSPKSITKSIKENNETLSETDLTVNQTSTSGFEMFKPNLSNKVSRPFTSPVRL